MRASALAPAALALLVGCSFDASNGASGAPDARVGGDPDGQPAADAAADADGRCAGDFLPFSAANLPADPCALPGPGKPLVFATGQAYVLDTDQGTVAVTGGGTEPSLTALVVGQDSGPELLAVVAESITIEAGATVEVRGSRALALVSAGNLAIAGSLDAGAAADEAGAGAGHPGSCAGSAGGAGELAGAGAGGSGAGFGGPGGSGSLRSDDDGDPVEPGAAATDLDLVPLRGGCRGGAGASDTAGAGGAGGAGGGALELVAAGNVTVTGSGIVHAGGGGGQDPSASSSGGGGGGSGGAVLVVASDISVAGTIAANGGGGGEGTRGGAAADRGDDAEASATAAAGGEGLSNGGNGGNGGTAAEGAPGLGGEGGIAGPAGGGGGGGGTGRIVLDAQVDLDFTGVVSPPAS